MAFVCSPVADTEKKLVKLGKKLRKNAIALDVALLGNADEEQVSKLKKLVETVNNGDNSNFCQF